MPPRPSSQTLKPLLSAAADDASSYTSSYEKGPQPRSTQRRRRNVLLQPRVYMPIVIILGQSAILFGGWAFYLATRAKPTPLPDYLAVAAREAPSSVTFIVTLVATLISITTAFFYSHAIRYSVAMSLSQPMSLFAIASSMKMAGKRPVLNFRRLKWTISALVCVAALSAQTAGWTTLLTPRIIQIGTPILGYGVDFENERFVEKLKEDYDSDALHPHTYINITPLLADSGATTVSAMYNQTPNFNFNEMSFHKSTAGIMPLNLEVLLSAVGQSVDAMLPVTALTPPPPDPLPGFHSNYTVTQQGFTADIKCEYQPLDESTTPALEGPVEIPVNNEHGANLVYNWVRFTCRDGTQKAYGHTTEVGEDGANNIFATTCIMNNQTEYELILIGMGNYNWVNMTVCTISPKVTEVNVHYTQGAFSASRLPDTIYIDPPRKSEDQPTAGFVAASILPDALERMQGLTAHALGDSISMFYYQKAAIIDDRTVRNEVVREMLEAFLTGTFEFIGTLIRASYIESGNELWGEEGTPVPEEFRHITNGTFFAETIGWHQITSALPGVLLAPTFVAALSIVLVLLTLIRTTTSPDVEGQDHFDLNNILHVIAASSAGGFNDPFPSFEVDDDEHVSHSEKVKVKLGYTKSGQFGLVQQSNV